MRTSIVLLIVLLIIRSSAFSHNISEKTNSLTSHFVFTSNTGNNATVIVPTSAFPNINGSPLSNGDEIGVFTPNGLCVGGIVWNSMNTSITVWGDNEITPAIDGIQVGQEIKYRIWKQSTNTEYSTVYVMYDPANPFNSTGLYAINGIYRLIYLSILAPAANVNLYYPNNGAINISTNPILKWHAAANASIYFLQVSTDSLFTTMIYNDTTVTDTFKSISSLVLNTKYFWRVKSKNNGGTNPNWSVVWNFRTGQICKDVSILNGWNILSVPIIASDMTGTVLFPAVGSSFYAYNNGYQTVTQLQNSKGYWAKFNSSGIVPICGNAVSTNQIQVVNGWNMIGVYDYNVAISGITTTPSGIISSSFYEYNNGYLNPTTLVPGKGYWIKVNQNGTLNLPSTVLAKTEERGTSGEGLVTSEQKIIITDNSGISQTLYLTKEQQDLSYCELPPQAPQGIADIRFGSDRMVENINNEQLIRLNSVEYPIKIKVMGMDISLKDNIEGKLINKMLKDGEELIITNPQITTLKIKTIELPTEYSLSQNYPNPFNPMTIIQYEIPTSPLEGEGRRERNVSLKIYDIMGRIVETLVDEPQEAGRYQVEWDATRFSSGIYYYELTAGDFRAIKKMIMIK